MDSFFMWNGTNYLMDQMDQVDKMDFSVLLQKKSKVVHWVH